MDGSPGLGLRRLRGSWDRPVRMPVLVPLRVPVVVGRGRPGDRFFYFSAPLAASVHELHLILYADGEFSSTKAERNVLAARCPACSANHTRARIRHDTHERGSSRAAQRLGMLFEALRW